MSDKPVIFISHSAKDKELAGLLKRALDKSFGEYGVRLFLSSDPFAIPVGQSWFDNVIAGLNEATIFVVLVTPNSLKSEWVWFEIGYFWKKDNASIFPLHTSNVTIPSPLNALQAKSVGDRSEYLAFLLELHKKLLINIKNIPPDEIIELVTFVEKYSTSNSASIDEHSTKEILRDYLKYDYQPGVWITYKVLDSQKMLPEGASKSLLKLLAEEDEKIRLIVDEETDNGIRFKKPPLNFQTGVGAQSYIG